MAGSRRRREQDLKKAELIIQHTEDVIENLRKRQQELMGVRDEIDGELEEIEVTLQNMEEVKFRLLRTFPALGPHPRVSEDFPKDLRGVPLGEAMEVVLRAEGKPMHQNDLVEFLEVAGYPLGRNPGRKLHAASLNKDTIKKVRSKTYVYDEQGLE